MKNFIDSAKFFFYGILLYLPSEKMERFRAFFYRSIGVKIGINVRICVGALLDAWNPQVPFCLGNNITVGRNSLISGGVRVGSGTFFNSNVSVVASPPSTIEIGENCLIAQNVVFRSDDHVFDDTDTIISQQGRRGGDIHIEEDCWIGANAVLLKGVHLGAHSVVGAGSVVTKSFPAYSVIVGNPARLLKSRIKNQ